MLNGELTGNSRKRPSDVVPSGCEARALQLRRGVVVAVEHVIELRDQVQPFVETVADANVDDAIGRCRTWAEVVGIVWLVGIVLVSACERA